MLDLAHIPALAQQRTEADPFIVAGGPCACNPEPLADFFDLFMLGEGEVQLPMVCDTILQGRKEGLSKHEILVRLSRIEGVYVPSLYDVSYFPDGRIEKVTAREGAPTVVRKAIIQDMNSQMCIRDSYRADRGIGSAAFGGFDSFRAGHHGRRWCFVRFFYR